MTLLEIHCNKSSGIGEAECETDTQKRFFDQRNIAEGSDGFSFIMRLMPSSLDGENKESGTTMTLNRTVPPYFWPENPTVYDRNNNYASCYSIFLMCKNDDQRVYFRGAYLFMQRQDIAIEEGSTAGEIHQKAQNYASYKGMVNEFRNMKVDAQRNLLETKIKTCRAFEYIPEEILEKLRNERGK